MFRCQFLLVTAYVAVCCIFSQPAPAQQPAHLRNTVDSLVVTATGQYSGDQSDAIACLHKAYSIIQTNKQLFTPAKEAYVCLMMGNVYLNYGDTPNALKYYEKGYAITPDAAMKLSLTNNISVTYCIAGNEAKAREYNDKLLKIPTSEKSLAKYDHLISGAYIEKSFGSRERSVDLFRQALEMVPHIEKGEEVSYSLTPVSELCEYYESTEMLDSAAKYLNMYERLAEECKFSHMIADSQRGLMRLYIKQGDREKALMYSNKYFDTMDSMVNPAKFIKVTSAEQRRNEEEAQRHIERLEFSVTRLQAILIAVSIILFVAASLWLFSKKIKGVRRFLFAKNREIALLQQGIPIAPTPQKPAVMEADTVVDKTSSDTPSAQWSELMVEIERVVTDPTYLCDPDFSLTTLAGMVNSNTKYVSQAINETTGENFRSYINRFRIDEARRRLTSDPEYANLTIQSIGESVGFRSASNFFIAFKKVTGLTPAAYQKMVKNG